MTFLSSCVFIKTVDNEKVLTYRTLLVVAVVAFMSYSQLSAVAINELHLWLYYFYANLTIYLLNFPLRNFYMLLSLYCQRGCDPLPFCQQKRILHQTDIGIFYADFLRFEHSFSMENCFITRCK